MSADAARRVLTLDQVASWQGPPLIVFVGVSTGGSLAHTVFDRWARLLGQPWTLRGVDLPLDAPPWTYQRLLAAMRDNPAVHGAIVTAHKLRLYRGCAPDLERPAHPLPGGRRRRHRAAARPPPRPRRHQRCHAPSRPAGQRRLRRPQPARAGRPAAGCRACRTRPHPGLVRSGAWPRRLRPAARRAALAGAGGQRHRAGQGRPRQPGQRRGPAGSRHPGLGPQLPRHPDLPAPGRRPRRPDRGRLGLLRRRLGRWPDCHRPHPLQQRPAHPLQTGRRAITPTTITASRGGPAITMSDEVTPFRIEVPDADLSDLHARLERTRWPEPETVDDWSQGVPLAYLRELCGYWAHDYDWRATETRLNALPPFRTEIDGLGIHFVHVRSPHPDALPLVLTHGWPGSIVEFLKVIGPLADPTAHGGRPADAFHVVCPSLPGYGFSEKPARSGWGVERIAGAWARLMARLV